MHDAAGGGRPPRRVSPAAKRHRERVLRGAEWDESTVDPVTGQTSRAGAVAALRDGLQRFNHNTVCWAACDADEEDEATATVEWGLMVAASNLPWKAAQAFSSGSTAPNADLDELAAAATQRRTDAAARAAELAAQIELTRMQIDDLKPSAAHGGLYTSTRTSLRSEDPTKCAVAEKQLSTLLEAQAYEQGAVCPAPEVAWPALVNAALDGSVAIYLLHLDVQTPLWEGRMDEYEWSKIIGGMRVSRFSLLLCK